MKFVYVVNRFNLKEKTQNIINKLQTLSEKHHRDYEICLIEDPGEAKEKISAYRNGSHIITAIGGDGSINLLLNDLIGTDNILSFIPHGTGNDFYRYCKENLSDGIHEVDLVQINERCFINVACFGIDADIANDDNFIHNRLIPASMRYNAGVVYYFLTYKPRQMEVTVNGKTFSQSFTTIIAANAKDYGGGYRPSPHSDIQDGKIEVLLVDPLNKLRMAKTILSMKDSSHLKSPAVHLFETDSLSIRCSTPISANIDGEPLTSDHFDLKIVPKGFRIYLDHSFVQEMGI